MPSNEEVLPNGTRVFTSPAHRFGTDALLLAAFCEPHRGWSACDLGTGCGILLLALADAGLAGRCTGIELDPAGAQLLAGAAKANQLPHIHAIAGDLRSFTAPHPFDLVVSNPPYFSSGLLPPNAQRARARHEQDCTLQDLCAAAARNLKDRARFCVCFPASRMAELLYTAHEYHLEPKRLRLVRKSHEQEPWLVLLDARKAGGPGLRILPDLLLRPGEHIHF